MLRLTVMPPLRGPGLLLDDEAADAVVGARRERDDRRRARRWSPTSSCRRSRTRRRRARLGTRGCACRCRRRTPTATGSRAARRSPAAGSQRCFCSSVPWCTMRYAAIVCVLTMPDSDIQPYASSSTTPMYVSRSSPRPPYSSGIVIPNRPSAFICSTIAVGILVGVLELGRDRDHLAGDEAADGLDQLAADLGIGRRRSCGARYADAVTQPGTEPVAAAGTVRPPDDESHARFRASGATRRMRGARIEPATSCGASSTYVRPVPRPLIGFIIAVVVDAIVDGDPAAARARSSSTTRSRRAPQPPARHGRRLGRGRARVRRRDALARAALLSSRVGEGLIYDLRVALFDHVQRMPLAFFTRTQTGALQSRLEQRRDRRAAGRHDHARHRRLERHQPRRRAHDHVQARLAAHAPDADRAARVHLSRAPARPAHAEAHPRGHAAERGDEQPHRRALQRRRARCSPSSSAGPTRERDRFSSRAAGVRDIGVAHRDLQPRSCSSRSASSPRSAPRSSTSSAATSRSPARSRPGTVVAFVIYVGQIYQPLAQLTNSRVDVLTALVSFERVFEVLDFPAVDRRPARRGRSRRARRAASSSTTCGSATRRATRCRSRRWRRRARRAATSRATGSCATSRSSSSRARRSRSSARRARARPRSRCSCRASYEVDAGRGPRRRPRRARPHARVAARGDRARAAGPAPLPRHASAPTCCFARAGRDRRRASTGAAARGAHLGSRRVAARRPRHRRRRARLPHVGRREATPRDRAVAAEGSRRS